MNKNIMLAATFSIGMAAGAVTKNVTEAKGEQTVQAVTVTKWIDEIDSEFVEKELVAKICEDLKMTDCNVTKFRKEAVCARYLDSDRNGQPDKWRLEAQVIVPGKFIAK